MLNRSDKQQIRMGYAILIQLLLTLEMRQYRQC